MIVRPLLLREITAACQCGHGVVKPEATLPGPWHCHGATRMTEACRLMAIIAMPPGHRRRGPRQPQGHAGG